MGLLKQKQKLIIHPDDFDTKSSPKMLDLDTIKRDVDDKFKDTDLSEDDIVSNHILNDGKKAKSVDEEYILPSRKVQMVDELPKFQTGHKNRIQIDPERVSMKCPECKTIHAFTQNIIEIKCCGITYSKALR